MMTKVDEFTMTDSFNLDLETIQDYANDAAQRNGELIGYKPEKVNVVLTDTDKNGVRHYEIIVEGKMIGTFNEDIKKAVNSVDIPFPLFDFDIFNLSFFVWKKPEMHVELVETFPYALDGSHPLITVQFGWIEMIFESRTIYKWLYKRKHGEVPRGLESADS